MNENISRFRKWWQKVRKTSGYRNVLLYFVFVGIAFLFWLILSLNNSIQETVSVNLRIYNVPDSVTFLSEPPSQFHLSVRDKGTSLLRTGIMNTPTLNINFKEYAHSGELRYTSSDLYSSLRNIFGSNAQFTSLSLDSLHCNYTTNPGKKIPVQVAYDITTSTGKTLASLEPLPSRIEAFSNSDIVDTLSRVFTAKIVRRDLNESEELQVKLVPPPGVKVIPSSIKVKVNVDALVRKNETIPVRVMNLPKGESALLYPDKVEIQYFVPMAKFNEGSKVKAVVDYTSILESHNGMANVRLIDLPPYYVNVIQLTDSVEFTLVK